MILSQPFLSLLFIACWSNVSSADPRLRASRNIHQDSEPARALTADGCPNNEPTAGAACDLVDGECRYNYIAIGCSYDEIQCVAIDHFTCKDYEWEHASMAIPPCDNGYSPPGKCVGSGVFAPNQKNSN